MGTSVSPWREAYSDLPTVANLEAMRKASPVHYVHQVRAPVLMLLGRGLHASTFQLNLSRF